MLALRTPVPKSIMYFMVSAVGASEKNLSNFCITLFKNAMKGVVEKMVSSLLLTTK